jgi:hypothetical protein
VEVFVTSINRSRARAIVLLAVMLCGWVPHAGAASPEELDQKLKSMEAEINDLKRQLQEIKAAPPPTAQTPPQEQPPGTPPAQAAVQLTPQSVPPPTANKDIFGILPSPIEGLKLGMYGEFKFGNRQNPGHNGQWQNGFDAARIVLLPSFQFTDDIIFNAEIEFEHAGFAADADDKLNGAVGIEQAWVDFKVNRYFNIRSPGIDLVPVGYTNLYHEPTLFESVNRPTLANGLVPTTWSAPSLSVYGKIVDNVNYQIQVSSTLEDFGAGFGARADGNSVPPFPEGYAPGITGKTALALARPPLGDFRQLSNVLATAVRLSYTPPFMPGLAGSTSVYYSPSTTPRGAYSDTGLPLKRSSLTLADTEFRYRVPGTGLEFRAEYVQSFFGSPANLRANNDSDPTNNVGRSLYGMSGEIAYHFLLGRALGTEWELVPFYRYTYQNLQTGGFRGSDLNTPTGSGQQQIQTMGFAVFPGRKLVLKLSYEHVSDSQPGGCKCDYVLGGVGFYF